MTRDDIIRMAREAGMERVIDVHKDGTRTIELPHPDLLKRFAALVAAAEREACAKECDDVCANFYALYKGRPPYTGKENGRGDPISDGASHGAEKCAAAIRARGGE